jgi:serine protease Do
MMTPRRRERWAVAGTRLAAMVGICGFMAGSFAGTAAAVDPEVLAAEAARVGAIRRAAETAVAIFAGSTGGGSGVLVSPDGYALTNFHVVQSAGPALRCGLADGRLYDAVLVGLDPTGDVALVKLLGRDDFPCAELADSDEVAVGDFCFAAGNPFLLATDLSPSISAGIVSGVRRYQFPAGTILEYTDCLQVDAAINPGNSGGGLFDATGRLIGVNGRASFEKRGRVNVGVGYAISSNQLRNFLGGLRGGRLVDHASLGATVATSADGRVVVSDILESSDAWRRGLRYDDEVLAVAGRPVRTVNAFKNVLGTLPAGWQVPLVHRRDGRRLEALVRLAAVHSPAELAAFVAGDREGTEPRPPEGKPERRRATPENAAAEMPPAVAAAYEPRAGFVNFHFNRLERDRLARAIAASPAAAVAATWEFGGEMPEGGAYRLVVSDDEATLDLPGGRWRLLATGDLDGATDPPGSGGMLAAVVLWRRLVREGAAALGGTTYVGTAARVPEAVGTPAGRELIDVLETNVAGVTARFGIDAGGRVVAIDLWTSPDDDPCEIRLGGAEATADGLPTVIDVRRGTVPFAVLRDGREPASSVGLLPEGRPVPDPGSPQAMIAAAARRVVKIYGAGGLRGLEAYQSGILVAPEGVILTAASTVLDSEAIDVVLDDGRRFEATLVGVDPWRELAVLTIEAEELPAFTLVDAAEADGVAIGTRVVALSNLFGVAVGDERVSAQRGLVSAVVPLEARRGAAEAAFSGPVLILDVTTNNPGAAGGALVAADGRLLGMLGKELRATASGAWLNYALPAAELARGRHDVVAGKAAVAAGLRTAPLPARAVGLVLVPDLLDRTPPFVETVVPGSTAARAGLAADDLVVAVGGRAVGSRAAFELALGRLAPGDPVRLAVIREGEIVEVDLGPRPREGGP